LPDFAYTIISTFPGVKSPDPRRSAPPLGVLGPRHHFRLARQRSHS